MLVYGSYSKVFSADLAEGLQYVTQTRHGIEHCYCLTLA
jgi:hypothetical protein